MGFRNNESGHAGELHGKVHPDLQKKFDKEKKEREAIPTWLESLPNTICGMFVNKDMQSITDKIGNHMFMIKPFSSVKEIEKKINGLFDEDCE